MFADKEIPERFRYRRGVSPGFRQGCGFSARARRLSAPLGHGRYRDHDDGVSEHKFDVDIREGQAMDLAHARSGLSADRLERITSIETISSPARSPAASWRSPATAISPISSPSATWTANAARRRPTTPST